MVLVSRPPAVKIDFRCLLLLSTFQIWNWVTNSVSSLSNGVVSIFGGSPLLPDDYVCTQEYSIELLSVDPLVIYVNGFVKDHEINHLIHKTKDDFSPSFVYDYKTDKNEILSEVNSTWRSSTSAMVSKRDPVSRCLAKRLKSLMGNLQHPDTERLQIVKYVGGERFRMHNDYLPVHLEAKHPDGSTKKFNRLVSSFIYIGDNCTGGETYFPDIKGVGPNADGDKFSRTEDGMGLLVKPKKGNAVIWHNVHQNGTGDERMAHAGLPVVNGTKIGMNLFGIYYPDEPLVGGT
ncbi:2OG-Fe(II) oxygenase family Oxidoreductase [Fusarium pseudoanthophilum]|uniref:2OG-Fe(II) oxygenase family Oxidoreductase n=1 Tax=Fusarium pseudoanthophilum TaxID=48495 RepID=A0A8H5NZN6_9HYPO|nr:2OG-Fe(II) oxygenase family Oxidoreductase [Fusarium pseudoanthophilum]